MKYVTHRSLWFAVFSCATVLLGCFLFAGCLTSPEEEEPPAPVVEIDPDYLDFGETMSSLSFVVKPDEAETEWKLSGELPSWCVLDVESGTGGAEVTVSIDRSSLAPGEYTASIGVKWDSGSRTVKIRAVVPSEEDTGTVIIDTPLPEKEEITR